jgi:hypothetical protein
MGEAKRKMEELRRTVLTFMERWDFPPSEAEARAVEEIKKLPVVIARRQPAHVLAYMRMPPNQCHTNARFMEENDPEGKNKKVSGYILQSNNYVLHSVVEKDGNFICVTPMQIGGPDEFPFIPDPDIEWRLEGDTWEASRKGLPIEVGFRRDPVESQRILEIVRARIEAGVHPLKAGEPPF